MSDTEFFLDTNVLVYAYDRSEGIKHEQAKEIIRQCFRGKITLFLSTQVLGEFFTNITKKIQKPISPQDAHAIISTLIDYQKTPVLVIQPDTILSASLTHQTTGTHFWDCVIAETMKENRIHIILTEDTADFSKISGIKAKNPFK